MNVAVPPITRTRPPLAVLVAIVRNPLASPDLLGLSSGASAAAVLYLSAFAATWGMGGLPLAAMLGAGSAALAVYGLAWKQGTSPLRLVLIGVGVSAMLAAATTFMLVFSPLSTIRATHRVMMSRLVMSALVG